MKLWPYALLGFILGLADIAVGLVVMGSGSETALKVFLACQALLIVGLMVVATVVIPLSVGRLLTQGTKNAPTSNNEEVNG